MIKKVLLLHGWASDARVWHGVRQSLEVGRLVVEAPDLPGMGVGDSWDVTWSDWDAYIKELASRVADADVVLGWSLGGQLALALKRAFPRRFGHVVLVASNPCFVARPGWSGMAPGVFSAFQQGFAADPARTLKRFMSLQVEGLPGARGVVRELGELLRRDWNYEALAALLGFLALDGREMLQGVAAGDVSVVLGELDALVPVAMMLAPQFLSVCPVRVLEGAGHALPLTHAEVLAEAVMNRIKTE